MSHPGPGGPTPPKNIRLKSQNTPKHPYYSDVFKRELTFKLHGWPAQMRQRPPEMAAAGFVYTGQRDAVVCFYCGCGLCEWQTTDDPYEEHARITTKCDFLLSMRSPEFVQLAQKRRSNTEAEITDLQESGKMPECVVCLHQERSVVFRPCGHLVTCVSCAFQVHRCVMCRAIINMRIKVYV